MLTEIRNLFGPLPDLPAPFGTAMKHMLMHGLSLKLYIEGFENIYRSTYHEAIRRFR